MNAMTPMKPISAKAPFGVLDIGSSKLGCLIVEPAGETLNVLAHAMHASAGIHRGEISDLTLFSETVGKVVEAAERNAGLTIKDLHVVMPGGQAKSVINRFQLELADPIISRRDIRRLLAKQMQIALPEGRSLIASERLHYILDGSAHVQNPKGMRAHHLALDATALSITSSAYHNISEAVEHNHLTMGRVGHCAHASALACLSQEDADLGALVIDMGGGTTSTALFLNNNVIGITSVPIGGNQITRDIARILSISLADAERLKAVEGAITPSHGEALGDILSPPPFLTSGDNFIPATSPYQMQDIALPNGESTSRALLSNIIRPRVEEILDLTYNKLVDSGLENHMSQRVVLTGGASQLTGMADFVSQYWKRRATLALPHHIMGLDEQSSNPAFSALVGMALHVARIAEDDFKDFNPAMLSKTPFGRFGMWLSTHL